MTTVSEGGILDIEMRVKTGRGYVSAEKNFDEELPMGYIPIDSVHSPVRKVNFTVDQARIGQMTDYDKLGPRSLDQRRRDARRTPSAWPPS